MKKLTKSIAVAASVIAGVLLYLVVRGNRVAVYDAQFDSYEAADRAGALGEGLWIPKYIHASANSIIEAHDIDTNEVWLSYRFRRGDSGFVSPTCTKLSQDDVSWPDEKRLDKFPRFAGEAYRSARDAGIYFVCAHERARYFFALDEQDGEVSGWSLGH